MSTEDLPRSIDAQLVQAVVIKERLIKTPKDRLSSRKISFGPHDER